MSSGDGEASERRWIRETLKQHLLPGDDVGEPTRLGTIGSGYASTLFTVDTRDDSLVVKILPEEPRRTIRHLDDQFINEAYFYSNVLPFLLDSPLSDQIRNLFPKFFCAHQDCFQSLVAIRNLSPLGYKLAPKHLDYAHMKMSLEELGKFHALSYLSKKKQPDAFEKIVKGLQPRTQVVGEMIILIKEFLEFAAELFEARYPEESKKYGKKLATLHELVDRFASSTEPVEPLAVVCHGDFNRNNLLFKYDDDGRPSSVKFIDFQLSTYSSPAIDLSLILFLSTSPNVRNRHWEDLFRAYHSSLLEAMEQSLCCKREELEKEYSIDLLMEEFKRCCLHGFLITIFFLPITMLPPSLLVKLELESDLNESAPEDIKSSVSFIAQNCSEDVKYCLAELLKEVLEKHYI